MNLPSLTTAVVGLHMYRVEPQGFIDESGRTSAFLELRSGESAAEWGQKQLSSMDEYFAHPESPPEETGPFYQLFDAYISSATYAKTPLKILDVGCGVSTQPPLYAGTLVKNGAGGDRIYVGIDPIRHNISGRAYPFICGRIEDLPKNLDDKFDVFLFSTTLDHFERIESVATIVRQLANKDATCIFWIGLHDTQIVAEQEGSKAFLKLYRSLNPFRFLFRFGVALLRLLHFYWLMRQRQYHLVTGQPLDNFHFHYFTTDNVRQYLALFGRVTNQIRIPGTNMLFATVALGNSR